MNSWRASKCWCRQHERGDLACLLLI